jgi:hypothetical protein
MMDFICMFDGLGLAAFLQALPRILKLGLHCSNAIFCAMMRTASSHQGAKMRTTIDLPQDLHDIASSFAHSERTSVSKVVSDLMRRALKMGQYSDYAREAQDSDIGKLIPHPITGFPTMRLSNRVITPEIVRQAQDEDWGDE